MQTPLSKIAPVRAPNTFEDLLARSNADLAGKYFDEVAKRRGTKALRFATNALAVYLKESGIKSLDQINDARSVYEAFLAFVKGSHYSRSTQETLTDYTSWFFSKVLGLTTSLTDRVIESSGPEFAAKLAKWKARYRKPMMVNRVADIVFKIYADKGVFDIRCLANPEKECALVIAQINKMRLKHEQKRVYGIYARSLFSEIYVLPASHPRKEKRAEPLRSTSKNDSQKLQTDFKGAAKNVVAQKSSKQAPKPQIISTQMTISERPKHAEPSRPSKPAFEAKASPPPRKDIERFAYPKAQARPIAGKTVAFEDIALDVRESKGKVILNETQAIRLLTILDWLKKERGEKNITIKPYTTTYIREKVAFLAKFGSIGSPTQSSLVEIGVFRKEGVNGLASPLFTDSFVDYFNNKENRAALYQWAEEYKDFRKVLSAWIWASEARGLPDPEPK